MADVRRVKAPSEKRDTHGPMVRLRDSVCNPGVYTPRQVASLLPRLQLGSDDKRCSTCNDWFPLRLAWALQYASTQLGTSWPNRKPQQRATASARNRFAQAGDHEVFIMKNTTLKFLSLVLGAVVAQCGSPLEDNLVEDLGPYAEQMPWAEYMAAATDTVAQAAASSACTTASVRGLSDQIVAEMNCIKPNLMSRIDGLNVSLGGAALPFLQTPAANALRAATTGRAKLGINSSLRSLAQQWMLRNWADTNRCGVSIAARPGASNHEDGLAIDTSDYSSYRSALTANKFSWFGSSDAVHFDYSGAGGVDARGVLAFQRLWNRNNPSDRIAEDGSYGPNTESRLKRSPRVGFPGTQSCR